MARILVPKIKSTNNYFDFIKNINHTKAELNTERIKPYIEKLTALNTLNVFLPCGIFVLDYSIRNYLYLSKNAETITGYPLEELYRYGQDLQINNTHPEDLKIFTSDVFTIFLLHTKTIEKSELEKTRFSVNFRYKRKDGVLIHVLQQYVVLETDKNGNPLITMGIWADMTSHKNDNKVVFSISKYHENTGYSVISTETFPNNKIIISERENDVLKYLMQGYTSKKIADALSLSVFTINAHRRNILEKTKCNNIVELFNYAIENGLG